jgi:DNA processing protein
LNLHAWLRFALAPKLTYASRFALLKAFGAPDRVFAASHEALAAAVGERIAAALADALKAEPRTQELDRAVAWLAEPNHHFVGMGESAYPLAFLEMPDPPIALYVQGRIELLNAPAIGIVGSRNATVEGVRDAEAFAETLSRHGLTIVSGMALGIDSAAHLGGLRARGSSVAVLGTGADRIYPPRNRELAHRLANEGAIVSEFPLGTPPVRENFPQRNRLISGLAKGVLVVEAATGSGSLITAKCAVDQNRDVFAIPGSIHSTVSRGCHKLIRDGAKLVECAEDILEELNLVPKAATKQTVAVPERSDPLLEAMGRAPTSIDEIAVRMGRPAAFVAAGISALEIEGRVAALASGLFQRLERR